MLITLNGIVIGQRAIGENSCFLDVFTDKLGIIEVMAHGVKKLNSKCASACTLFSYSLFCLNKNGSKYTVNSAEPICSFYKLSNDIEALSLAAYFSDVIKYCATSEELHSNLLRFVCMAFYQLEKKKLPYDFIKAVFEFRFITHIGFMPDLRACHECICYLSDKMYFIPLDGHLYCEDCYQNLGLSSRSIAFPLNKTLVHTLRYVAYSDYEKLYRFRISEDNMKAFAQIAENYLLTQLDRSFETLDYYKNIMKNIQAKE